MRRAISIVFLLLAASGCKRTLHWKTVEDLLAANYHAKVTCPETAVEAGLKFRCHAITSDGSEGDIEVTLKDTAGSMEWRQVR